MKSIAVLFKSLRGPSSPIALQSYLLTKIVEGVVFAIRLNLAGYEVLAIRILNELVVEPGRIRVLSVQALWGSPCLLGHGGPDSFRLGNPDVPDLRVEGIWVVAIIEKLLRDLDCVGAVMKPPISGGNPIPQRAFTYP